MSKSPFTPNHRGLVVVKLVKSFGTNIAGETCGFYPDVARSLVHAGVAVLPGSAHPTNPAQDEHAPAMTTRKFHPLDRDQDGEKGGSKPASERPDLDPLREKYKEVTGADADQRWGAARLEAEIKKALYKPSEKVAEGNA